METLEEHRSPDNLLRFMVCRDKDGDVSAGFDGYSWHVHADSLAALAGLPQETALRRFVDEVLHDRAIIAIARVSGKIQQVWVAEDAQPDKWKPDEETIEFRYWSGASAV